MSISFSALPTWLRQQGQIFAGNVDRHLQDMAGYAAGIAIEGTPVDTGRARSNWNGSVGASSGATERDPYAPGSKLGRGETNNLAAALEPVLAAIEGWRPSTGSVFYLSNSVDYIEDLDGGKSPQGSNFSDAAVLSALTFIAGKQFI